MRSEFIKRITAALLLACMILSLSSCAACSPPELSEVKDTFIQLIEDSYSVNQILFGEGLSVYGSLKYDEESGVYYDIYTTAADGKLCAVYDKESKEYQVLRFGEEGDGAVYSNKEAGIWLYETSLDYTDGAQGLDADLPTGYHYVRLDERCTSINDITTLAYKVYSEDYLRDIFAITIGTSGDLAASEDISTKYSEISLVGYGDETDMKKALIRASSELVPPIVTEERIYDYESMKMMKNSRRTIVNIEIRSYGTCVNIEDGTVTKGWSTVSLSFVLQNGEWRLDTPTY